MIKVSSSSNPGAVAGAITNMMKEKDLIQIQVIGAASLNQAIKALAIARGYVAMMGFDLVCMPSFHDLTVEDKTITSIRLTIKRENFSE